MPDPRKTREKVALHFSRLLPVPAGGDGPCHSCRPDRGPALLAGYRQKELDALPPVTAASSLGCGNPVAFSGIAEGETVIDLGSGAGLDLILAARRSGPSGRIVGVDMSGAMIMRSRAHADGAACGNIELCQGIIEELPVESSSMDWVISNCVVNLSPEKTRVFAEIARVLRPGGHMLVADIVVDDLPGWARSNESLYSACIAGAVGEEEYLEYLGAAGLERVEVRRSLIYTPGQLKTFLHLETTGSGAEDPCSGSGFLTGALLGRAADLLAGRVGSTIFYARKP